MSGRLARSYLRFASFRVSGTHEIASSEALSPFIFAIIFGGGCCIRKKKGSGRKEEIEVNVRGSARGVAVLHAYRTLLKIKLPSPLKSGLFMIQLCTGKLYFSKLVALFVLPFRCCAQVSYNENKWVVALNKLCFALKRLTGALRK